MFFSFFFSFKKFSVGIELAAQPLVLFLDEPTSGLDSSAASSLCGALLQLSREGLTVGAVIHQPRYEIFQMFDDVLLLGKGGQTVYQGTVDGLTDYFEKLGYRVPPRINPADYFMDVVSGDAPPSDEMAARRALARARRQIIAHARLSGNAAQGEAVDDNNDNRGDDNRDDAADDEAGVEHDAAHLTERDLAQPGMLFECWRAERLAQSSDDNASEDLSVPGVVVDDERSRRPLGRSLSLYLWAVATLIMPLALAVIYLGEIPKPGPGYRRVPSQPAPRQVDRRGGINSGEMPGDGDSDNDDNDNIGHGEHASLLSRSAARSSASQQSQRTFSKVPGLSSTSYSLRARFGALTGACAAYVGWATAMILYGAFQRKYGYVAGGAVLAAVGLLCTIAVLLSYSDSIAQGSRRKATFLGNMLLGVALGPLSLLAIAVRMSHKARAALIGGGMLGSLVLMITIVFNSTSKMSTEEILVAVLVALVLLIGLLSSLLRYNHLPHSARETSGAVFQVFEFTMRGLTQLARNWQVNIFIFISFFIFFYIFLFVFLNRFSLFLDNYYRELY